MPTKEKAPSKREQKLIEQIKKDNEAYEALDKMGRRVRVSQEILLMIKKRTFIPGYGYGEVNLVRGKEPEEVLVDEDHSGYTLDFPLGDLQPIIRAGGFECVGCAKAAVIVARAAVGNKVKVTRRSMDKYDGNASILANKVSYEVFGKSAADIIEGLYEGWSKGSYNYGEIMRGPLRNSMHRVDAYEKLLYELSRFGENERMVAIYQSIIDNKGHLVVGQYKY